MVCGLGQPLGVSVFLVDDTTSGCQDRAPYEANVHEESLAACILRPGVFERPGREIQFYEFYDIDPRVRITARTSKRPAINDAKLKIPARRRWITLSVGSWLTSLQRVVSAEPSTILVHRHRYPRDPRMDEGPKELKL